MAGLVLGTGATHGICRFTDRDFFTSPVSVITGIFFGFQPACQAARLDPIVALHGE